MNNKKLESFIACALILAGMAIRLLPHPANFTPLTAMAVFSGAVLSPAWALSVPLFAMMASDLFLEPHRLFWLTWGCFLLTVFIGFWVQQNRKVLTVICGTLAGSVLFFVVTNLGVFLFQDMYPKNFGGFVQCYTMALPFFRNSLLGDFFYSTLFFGVFYWIQNYSKEPLRSRSKQQ